MEDRDLNRQLVDVATDTTQNLLAGFKPVDRSGESKDSVAFVPGN